MNKLFGIFLLALLCVSVATAADCTYYTYQSKTDGGTDYRGVNTATVNTTTMGADQVFTAYTAFTPVANFSRAVTEQITGAMNTSTTTIHWITGGTPFTTVNSTLVLTTGATTIGKANYTLTPVNASLNTTYVIYWNTATYNGTMINVTFNRTFVKNVDDLIAHPELVDSDTPFASSWLDQSSTGVYGASATIKLDDYLAYGGMVNNTNWAVTWSYTERSCVTTQADDGTYNGIHNTKNLAYAGFALIAVMVLIAAIWGIITLIQGGSVDLVAVAVTVIGGGVVVTIAYLIIYFIAHALGG